MFRFFFKNDGQTTDKKPKEKDISAMTQFKQQAILALKQIKHDIDPTAYRLIKRSIVSNKPAYHHNEHLTVELTPSGDRQASFSIHTDTTHYTINE